MAGKHAPQDWKLRRTRVRVVGFLLGSSVSVYLLVRWLDSLMVEWVTVAAVVSAAILTVILAYEERG